MKMFKYSIKNGYFLSSKNKIEANVGWSILQLSESVKKEGTPSNCNIYMQTNILHSSDLHRVTCRWHRNRKA